MSTPAVSLRRRLVALLGALTLATAVLPSSAAPAAAAGGVFFSEYVEGSSNNKALEIYNATGGPVNLSASGYGIQMFFNGSNTAGLTIALTGTLAAGDVHVIAHSSADPAILAVADQTNGAGWFNGDDVVMLVANATPVDVIGQIGFDPGSEWGSALTSTADNTLRRKLTITTGDFDFSNAFDPTTEWDGFATDAFDGLGSHTLAGEPQPVVASCGPAVTTLEGTAATRTVTASDADGVVTNLAISAMSPDPGTIGIGATSPAGSIGGTASADVTIGSATPVGTYTLTITATNSDTTPQTADCTLAVSVQEVLTIGEVQGVVEDGTDGHSHVSPYVGQQVFVRGVITAHHGEGNVKGVYLQSTPAFDDADPRSSDGIFVFQSRFDDIRILGGGSYVPVVGDEVVLRGSVSEFFNMTQLGSVFLAGIVASDVALPAAVQAHPPTDLTEAGVYWERLEGMLVQLPAGSIAQGGRDVFGTVDGELWFVRGDSTWGERDGYERRVFRDPHPLDDVPDQLFDNGNGDRILLGSSGLQGAARVAGKTAIEDRVIAPGRTFDVSTNAPIGPLNYSFGKYRIEVTTQVELAPGIDPSLNAPPEEPLREVEYSTATYNVENLYDFRDDPFDGCDFNDADNPGCPPIDSQGRFAVRPPYNYVPASEAEYQAHLAGLANQIVADLHAPDILLIQEAEDQDICTVEVDLLLCGTTDDADGKPDTLQELALRIAGAGGPAYDAAYDRNGADDRGIVSAFLYRTDRVELLPVDAGHPVLGGEPQIEYPSEGLAYNSDVQNPKALNAVLPDGLVLGDGCDELPDRRCVFTRDPQVGLFRVWRGSIGASVFTDVYAISNHFSSGPDNPQRRDQRIQQARYNAAIVAALLEEDAEARVITGGDFNVFPRPDEPFLDDASDQLGSLYELGLTDLWAVVVAEVPEAAYSYVFNGQAQTLDNQFVTDALADELNGVQFAHVNADWPAAYDGDGTRGASDHDPQVARFDAVTIDALLALVEYYRTLGLVGEDDAERLLALLDEAETAFDRGDSGRASGSVGRFLGEVHHLEARGDLEREIADVLAVETKLLIPPG